MNDNKSREFEDLSDAELLHLKRERRPEKNSFDSMPGVTQIGGVVKHLDAAKSLLDVEAEYGNTGRRSEVIMIQNQIVNLSRRLVPLDREQEEN